MPSRATGDCCGVPMLPAESVVERRGQALLPESGKSSRSRKGEIGGNLAVVLREAFSGLGKAGRPNVETL